MAAAKVGGIIANRTYPVDFFNENILIQNSLLNCALKFKIKRTVFLGTSCIYPDKAKTPIKEEALLTGKLHPSNEAYAIAKIAGIKLCNALYNQYKLDVVALMPTNVYGPNEIVDGDWAAVIGIWRRQVRDGQPITIIGDGEGATAIATVNKQTGGPSSKKLLGSKINTIGVLNQIMSNAL